MYFDRKILRRRKLGDKVIPKVTLSSIADNRINNNRNEMNEVLPEIRLFCMSAVLEDA